MHTVGELSTIAGVSVRTLHHYDEIGLLVPSGRSDAGYRLYSYAELERLQEILVWRQLGFALEDIRALLEDTAHDREAALLRQLELVASERECLGATARALDAALAAHRQGEQMTPTSVFANFDPSENEEEARERWGRTDAYRESARRTARYGAAEWAQIRAEADAVVAAFARLLMAGAAGGEDARAVAERHRRHMTRWFYDVSPQMHRNLAEMYIADARFAASYEKVAPGLAQYVHDAVQANSKVSRRWPRGQDGRPRVPATPRSPDRAEG
jgi:DNA-binding transcriptional MerR regulator